MIGRLASWLRRCLAAPGPALLAGAFAVLCVGRTLDPKPGQALGLLFFGALLGLFIWGLMRLFAARAWGLVVAGMLSGPVPLALLWKDDGSSPQDRSGQLLIGLLLGALIGVLEANRQARAGPGKAAQQTGARREPTQE